MLDDKDITKGTQGPGQGDIGDQCETCDEISVWYTRGPGPQEPALTPGASCVHLSLPSPGLRMVPYSC